VVTWNPAEKEEEEYPERANKLILKQILLGVEAKADEYNVVEVSNLFTLTSKPVFLGILLCISTIFLCTFFVG
jgi:Nucleoplasmin/nucleophosmin domain